MNRSVSFILGLMILCITPFARGQVVNYLVDPGGGSGATHGAIQPALDDCPSPPDFCNVEVVSGTYYEKLNFLGKIIDLHSQAGPLVTIVDASNVAASPYNDTAVRFVTGEQGKTLMRGFTVTGGVGAVGGIEVSNAAYPSLENLIITDNEGIETGGLSIEDSSQMIMIDLEISDNTGDAGGIYLENSTPNKMENFVVHHNIGVKVGGLSFHSSIATITDLEVFANETVPNLVYGTENASGLNAEYSSEVVVKNSLFSGNLTRLATIMTNIESDVTLIHSTVAGNDSLVASLYLANDSSFHVENSIVWGNTGHEVQFNC